MMMSGDGPGGPPEAKQRVELNKEGAAPVAEPPPKPKVQTPPSGPLQQAPASSGPVHASCFCVRGPRSMLWQRMCLEQLTLLPE